MQKTIGNELTVTYDEAFHEMSEEEIREMDLLNEAPLLSLSDPDRHMIITFGSQKLNGLSAMMLSGKDIAKRNEEAVRNAMTVPYNYQLSEFVKTDAGGKEANGFRYTYTAKNTEMTGEVLAVKNGKNIWYCNSYFRTESADECIRIFHEIIGSSQWTA